MRVDFDLDLNRVIHGLRLFQDIDSVFFDGVRLRLNFLGGAVAVSSKDVHRVGKHCVSRGLQRVPRRVDVTFLAELGGDRGVAVVLGALIRNLARRNAPGLFPTTVIAVH